MTQLNNMLTALSREVKVEQSTRLINKYEVNIQGCMELGINWGRFKASEIFASFFDVEVELRSVTACNTNENPPTRHQPGGTGLLVINKLIKYCKNPYTVFRKLGQWSSYVPEGSPNIE